MKVPQKSDQKTSQNKSFEKSDHTFHQSCLPDSSEFFNILTTKMKGNAPTLLWIRKFFRCAASLNALGFTIATISNTVITVSHHFWCKHFVYFCNKLCGTTHGDFLVLFVYFCNKVCGTTHGDFWHFFGHFFKKLGRFLFRGKSLVAFFWSLFSKWNASLFILAAFQDFRPKNPRFPTFMMKEVSPSGSLA